MIEIRLKHKIVLDYGGGHLIEVPPEAMSIVDDQPQPVVEAPHEIMVTERSDTMNPTLKEFVMIGWAACGIVGLVLIAHVSLPLLDHFIFQSFCR